MVDEPLEELYFNWLSAKVLPPHSVNYHGLLTVLHRTEFSWVVIGDDNRALDGMELRLDFLRETNYFKEHNWFEAPCSVLEMLVALAGRATFQIEWGIENWFWKFIENLHLDEYRRISDAEIPAIQEILNRFIWRTYRDNGDGGLFPLCEPHRDQTKVEIWYQFCDYVADQGLF